ncbi:MAG: ATP-dependent DNA ligase [Parachlamydiaceae bacterium]|nr:ATP-dependent DNA ligase [Parachlamydiaceae bacterium]
MESFLKLIEQLDSSTSTNQKVEALAHYFVNASPVDASWMLFFLSGHRLKRLISSRKLYIWCLEWLDIPEWLFLESYAQVGDTAELISLLIPPKPKVNDQSLSFSGWLQTYILPLKDLTDEEQKNAIIAQWSKQTQLECFVMNKILTGSFRIGVSHLLTLKGLEKAFDIPAAHLSHRLSGEWTPSAEAFLELISKENHSLSTSLNPYPFYLASPFEGDLTELEEPSEWAAEWKWDGIRAQLICRNGKIAIWSRGNDLITASFPELFNDQVMQHSYVLDGEILVFENERPRPFANLQKRLGRKKVTAAMQTQYPVAFMIYDVLEWDSVDLRSLPFSERRAKLNEVIPNVLQNDLWHISPLLQFTSWPEVLLLRQQAESNLTEGVMLKKLNSKYGVGRQRGYWWKYKIDTMTIDAVLIYAQPGSGYRSGLYTDYTFAVWSGDTLVPIAKAYSGLTKQEIAELDNWIRKHTVEKFGPVRQVEPFQVFEIAFENIQVSNRHKAGLALRFPRIKRWRKDKTYEMADHIETLQEQLKRRSTYG